LLLIWFETEEVYRLLSTINLDNRPIIVRAEIAKDYEERITFFSEEAKEVLQKDYLAINPPTTSP